MANRGSIGEGRNDKTAEEEARWQTLVRHMGRVHSLGGREGGKRERTEMGGGGDRQSGTVASTHTRMHATAYATTYACVQAGRQAGNNAGSCHIRSNAVVIARRHAGTNAQQYIWLESGRMDKRRRKQRQTGRPSMDVRHI